MAAFTFVPALNWMGSSGVSAGSRSGASGAGTGSGGGGGGVGAFTGIGSGADVYPWMTFENGRWVTRSLAPGTPTAQTRVPPAATGDPSRDYQAVSIPRNPALSSAVDDMLKRFKDTTNGALQDFKSYIPTFRSDMNAARNAAAQAQDIAPTVDALTNAQQAYAQNLSGARDDYQRALAATAAAQRGVVGQELANLGQYDTAVNNVRNVDLSMLGPYMAKYKAGTGTPEGGGSAEAGILAREVARIAAPFELQKIQENQRILSSQALPVEQGIGAQNIAFAGNFEPATAGSLYGSATNLANTVQALKTSVANMSRDNAIAFMQAQGVPAAVQAQVLGVQISELASLAGLDAAANYQGLNYLPGTSVTPQIGYDMSLPGYPQQPGVRPGMVPTQGPNLGPNRPVQTSPQTAPPPPNTSTAGNYGNWVYDPAAGGWYNFMNGEFTTTDPAVSTSQYVGTGWAGPNMSDIGTPGYNPLYSPSGYDYVNENTPG